jgi:coproporphyrinogen III oxidase-like Fe-S oxidoreductase
MTKPLLVYLHVPFCTSKCSFCDWVQEIPGEELRLTSKAPRRSKYIDALCQQIDHTALEVKARGYSPEIMYWGGGTASILSLEEIRQLSETIHRHYDVASFKEATIEASPETLTPEKLQAFLDFGFRRISIGIQALDDERLRVIGRMHRTKEAIDSVYMARAAGFEDVNVDIISGFPGETLAEFEASMKRVITLPITHVSLYSYRPALGTAMFKQLRRGSAGKTQLEEQLRAYECGAAMLEQAGLPEYAMSHFGNQRCYSDLAYFQLGMDWLGLGSGANSLMGGRFLTNRRGELDAYSEKPTVHDEDIPAASPHVASRMLYQALTTYEGICLPWWRERIGVEFAESRQQPAVTYLLDYLQRMAGLIEEDHHLRMPREKIASAFIHLLNANAPINARDRIGVNAVVGGY